MSKTVDLGPAPFTRGQRVRVSELNLAPWTGRVLSVKPSRISGWWLEVQQDDDLGTWSIPTTATDTDVIAIGDEG